MKICKERIILTLSLIQYLLISGFAQVTTQKNIETKFSPAEIHEKFNEWKIKTVLQNIYSPTEINEKSEANLQFAVGEFYESIDSSYLSLAFKYFQLASAKGFPKAQFKIGKMYSEGTGVVKDESLGIKWITKAAQQGDAEAQFELAGKFIEKEDFENVLKWLRLSAEQGNRFAQDMLAKMLHYDVKLDNGKHIGNLNESHKWYRKLANIGDVSGIYHIGSMYYEVVGFSRTVF